MKLGRAETAGLVQFTLISNTDRLTVEQPIAAMSAPDKAAALSAAILAQDPTWRAQVANATLTFEHLVGSEWLSVETLIDFSDTTEAGAQLVSVQVLPTFEFSLPEDSVATGFDAEGQPATITISLTETMAWTRVLQPGDGASQLLDHFQAFLADQAGAGVTLSRPSPGKILLDLDYPVSSFHWQVTDCGLKGKAKGSGGKDAGVIER